MSNKEDIKMERWFITEMPKKVMKFLNSHTEVYDIFGGHARRFKYFGNLSIIFGCNVYVKRCSGIYYVTVGDNDTEDLDEEEFNKKYIRPFHIRFESNYKHITGTHQMIEHFLEFCKKTIKEVPILEQDLLYVSNWERQEKAEIRSKEADLMEI